MLSELEEIKKVWPRAEWSLEFDMLLAHIKSVYAIEIRELITESDQLGLPVRVAWLLRVWLCALDNHDPRPDGRRTPAVNDIVFPTFDIDLEPMNRPIGIGVENLRQRHARDFNLQALMIVARMFGGNRGITRAQARSRNLPKRYRPLTGSDRGLDHHVALTVEAELLGVVRRWFNMHATPALVVKCDAAGSWAPISIKKPRSTCLSARQRITSSKFWAFEKKVTGEQVANPTRYCN